VEVERRLKCARVKLRPELHVKEKV
jgi:hypothetical protein